MITRKNADGHVEVLCCPESEPNLHDTSAITGCGAVLHEDGRDGEGAIDCRECGVWIENEDAGEWKPLIIYHVDVGNSTDGPLGLCARVTATSKGQALKMIREEVASEITVVQNNQACTNIEYVNVYINLEAITEDDIDEENPVRAEEGYQRQM